MDMLGEGVEEVEGGVGPALEERRGGGHEYKYIIDHMFRD